MRFAPHILKTQTVKGKVESRLSAKPVSLPTRNWQPVSRLQNRPLGNPDKLQNHNSMKNAMTVGTARSFTANAITDVQLCRIHAVWGLKILSGLAVHSGLPVLLPKYLFCWFSNSSLLIKPSASPVLTAYQLTAI